MERPQLVLIFDTETTGLPPKMGKDRKQHDAAEARLEGDTNESEPLWDSIIDQWPVTIQFSYIIYNLSTNQYSMYNKYIEDMPSGMAEAFLANPSTHYTVKGALEKREEQIAKKTAGARLRDRAFCGSEVFSGLSGPEVIRGRLFQKRATGGTR
jgi:hypothetical protein